MPKMTKNTTKMPKNAKNDLKWPKYTFKLQNMTPDRYWSGLKCADSFLGPDRWLQVRFWRFFTMKM
jgi:hypothetical protein